MKLPDDISYEEWRGTLTPEDLEGKGSGDVLTIEHINKAIEILDKAGKSRDTYYASRNLTSN